MLYAVVQRGFSSAPWRRFGCRQLTGWGRTQEVVGVCVLYVWRGRGGEDNAVGVREVEQVESPHPTTWGRIWTARLDAMHKHDATPSLWAMDTD